MAKSPKTAPPPAAKESADESERTGTPQTARPASSQPGRRRTGKSAPEPRLELEEGAPTTQPASNRRAARTPLDELNPTLVHLGNVVRRARQAKGMTQLQLAKACGFNGAAIFMVEKGRQNMTIKSLMTVASKLGLEVGDLFPRSTPRTAAKLTELKEVIGDVKDRVQAQLRTLERVSKELDEEAGNFD